MLFNGENPLFHFRSDEIFLRCIAMVFDLNCTEIVRPVLTSMGTCFNVLVGDIVKNIESMDLETTLIFDLHAAPQLRKYLLFIELRTGFVCLT